MFRYQRNVFLLCQLLVFFNVNSRASLVAQTVRSLAAVQEPWAQSLSGDGPLEKELAL